ncbi:MAG: hypothetical protein HYY34_00465 [Chloroflexi bacterium]|nr:hypothetical protein [Chloroflexota bacterium]
MWLVLAGVYGLSVWFGVHGWMSGPRSGFSVDFTGSSPVVTRVITAGPAWEVGVRRGFELVLIDGSTPTAERWQVTGDRDSEFVFRAGDGRLVTVPADSTAPVGTASVAMLELTALVFAAVSLFLGTRTYLTIEVAAFSWLGLIAAGAIAVAPGSLANDPAALRIQATTLHWLPAAFIVFFYAFGRAQSRQAGIPWSKWLLFLPGIAVLLDVLSGLESTTFPEIRPVALNLALAFLVGGIACGFVLLVRRYFATSSPVFREQTRVIVVGTAIAVAPVVLLSVLPEALGGDPVVPPQFAVLTTVLIPLTFGYAILRHELMGIRRLVHRGVSYALISALVILLYVGIITALRSVGASSIGNSALDLSVMVAILVGVPLVPQVRGMAFAAVDRLLYRDFVNHREVLREISIDAVHTTDLQGLNQGILKRVVDALGLPFAVFVMRNADGLEVLGRVGQVPQNLLDGGVKTPALEESNDPVTDLVDLGGDAGQALCVAIPGQQGQTGLLYLGPKLNGEPFRSDDLQMAQTAASLVSTVISRLRLLDELRAQSQELSKLNKRLVEVEEQQLARLSGYLHDEPLQKVTYVLGQYRDRYSDDELAKILLEVTNDLRLVSGTLSPAMLVDLGLVRALESLVHESEGRNRYHIDFQVSGLGREERLPIGVELTAYRVAQEALANCQKHSKATAIWIELAVSPDTLVLSVDDNGVGLNGATSQVHRASTHLGLRHLKQRVESYGGALLVTNRRSRGASVVATIPISKDVPDAGPEFRIHAN